ncbi:MAG: hypothetical protein ABIO55_00695 [Ginsengibacter sp.]
MTDKNSTEPKKKSQKEDSSTIENGDTLNAYNQAELDIQKDPDLNTEPKKSNDLDEGDLARLEGEK